ncbi:MAG: MFS transporter [Kiritimatiellia bacterium]
MKKIDYKWTALALLWVAFFLQQGTRQLLGPSVPAICASFGVDKVAIGVVGTVFAMMYGICVPFAGITADIFRRKWMVTIGVAIFCLGIFLSGFASSVGWLVVTYGILNGFGQTFYYPSATSLVSQLHKESRATAISILQLGLYIGIVGCGGLAGYLAGKGGENWRLPFWIFGGIGLAWSVVLLVFLKDTPPVASPAGTAEKPSILEAMKAVFAKPTALCVSIGLAMMIYVDIGFKNWMPAYLRDSFLESVPSLERWYGLHAVLWHYLGAVLGILLGSRAGDRLVAKRPGIRLDMGVIGLGLAIPFIVWMANADSFATCCVAMLGFGFFRGVYDSNFMASFFDVVNPRYHASGVGIMMCIAFLFGSLSSTVLPWMERLFGDMSKSMSSLAVFYLAGALVILLARVFFLERDRDARGA